MGKRILFVFLTVVAVAGIAFAQQVPGTLQDNTRDTMRSDEGAPSQMTPEQMKQHWQQNVARCLLLDNQGEVLINEFALERIQSPEVRQFAQTMVKDHNEMINKLQRFVPNAPTTDAVNKRISAIRMQLKSEKGTMPVTTDTDENNRRTEVPSPSMNGDREKMLMEGKNFMQLIPALQQTMAENCVAYTEAELSQMDKDMFDKAFMGQQIFNHVDALAKLRAMETFAPANVKPVVQQAIPIVQHHLDDARNICKQLENKTANRGNATPPPTREKY